MTNTHPEWFKRSEFDPPKAKHILVWKKDFHTAIIARYWQHRYFSDNLEGFIDDFTHWMPLPEPPKEQK